MVTIIDLDYGDEVAPRQTFEDGTFEFDLIDKRNYLVIVEGDNFFKIEEMFFLDGDMDLELKATNVSKVVTFKSIDFAKGSSKLEAKMENNLHLIIDFLVSHEDFNLRITGHTDSDGDADKNLALSQERAQVIKDYIISYGGLDNTRVEAIGMGNTAPIVENELTEEDKHKNRRVEFKLFRPGFE